MELANRHNNIGKWVLAIPQRLGRKRITIISLAFILIATATLCFYLYVRNVQRDKMMPYEWLVYEEELYSPDATKTFDLEKSLQQHKLDLQRKKLAAKKLGDSFKYFAGHLRLAIYPILTVDLKNKGYEIQLIKGDAKNPELLGKARQVDTSVSHLILESDKGEQLITFGKHFGSYEYVRFVYNNKLYTALPLRIRTLTAVTRFFHTNHILDWY